MRALDLRGLDNQLRPQKEEARRFLASFVAGRFEAAARACAKGFTWFGRLFDRSGWTGGSARAFFDVAPMRVENLRELQADLWAMLDAEAKTRVVGNRIAVEHIVLADIQRGDRLITLGVASSCVGGAAKIVSVFDPAQLVTELRAQLGPER